MIVESVKSEIISYYNHLDSDDYTIFNSIRHLEYFEDLKEIILDDAITYLKSNEDKFDKFNPLTGKPETFFCTILKNWTYVRVKNLSGFINGDKSLYYRDEENIRQFNGILSRAKREFKLKQLL